MVFEVGKTVILQESFNTKCDDFIGRIIGFDGEIERLKLQPLSVEHDLYTSYSRDYIVSNCGFYIDVFVNKPKTRLVQLLLEGCVYEI